LGTRRIQEGAEGWQRLFGEFRDAMDRDVDPGAAEVRALALRARGLISEFTGGDAGIEASLRRMYQEEGGGAVVTRHGGAMDPALWGYYGEAMKALASNPEEGS